MLRGITAFLTAFILFGAGASLQAQTDGCETAVADVRDFTANVYQTTLAHIEDGVIAWDASDWDQIVRRVVGTTEFVLNHCADPDQPLAEQTAFLEQLAADSQVMPPIELVDVGGDFGDVLLEPNYAPVTEFMDLNADGQDELLLHTQVPYFSQDTVYQIRGGLSIAFFQTGDGWQGQIIAPITRFVTDQSGPHRSYAMTDENTLDVTSSDQALAIFPHPDVRVMDVGGTPLTLVTLRSATATGEAKELDVITWEAGRFPQVQLRVAFDDWCYPGRELDWEIRADGSVYVPSNGADTDSPLHCGHTPEAVFQWANGHYSEGQ